MKAEDGPIVKLVNAILVSAIKKQARYISMMPGRLWFFRKGTWFDELRPPALLHTAMVRRMSVMVGHLAPGRVGEHRCGGIVLEMGEEKRRVGFATRIDRTVQGHAAFHRAFLEQVTPEELAARRPIEPRFPNGAPIPGFTVLSDPYRNQTVGTLFTDAIIEPPPPSSGVSDDEAGPDLDALFGAFDSSLLDK